MPSGHVFHLGDSEPNFANAHGTQQTAHQGKFPLLKGLAVYRVVIKPGTFREPHWHPNADEMAYVVRGSVLVTVFGNESKRSVFTVETGEMHFIPSGFLHGFENTGDTDAELIISFSHERPEDFGLAGSVGCMTLPVMGNTWGLDAAELGGITRKVEDLMIGKLDGEPEVPAGARDPHPYRYRVEEQDPPALPTAYGYGRTAKSTNWPVLRAQSMISLHLDGTGMREPHWHPEAAELGYVVEGHARMTVRGPETAVETYELHPGDIYFIPRAYLHHIEDLDNTPLRFLVFFDNPVGGDIGFTGGIAAFPNRVVAPTLGTTVAQMPKLPAYDKDLIIVAKKNPL